MAKNTQNTLLTFAVNPSTIDESTGLPTRFSGIAYSGGLIPAYGWHGDAAIELSSLHVPSGAIFALVDHDPKQRAGKLTATLTDSALHIEGEFFSNPAGREVAALFSEGAPWQLSVGIQAEAQQTDKPQTAAINGQQLTINTLFKNASLREVSFVPVGADPNTAVSAFAQTASDDLPNPEENTVELEALQSRVAELETALEAETAARQAAESEIATIQAAARQDAITQLAAATQQTFSDEQLTVFAAMDEKTFSTIADTLQAMKPAAPSHLFMEQATSGAETAPAESLQTLHANLLHQVATGKTQRGE